MAQLTPTATAPPAGKVLATALEPRLTAAAWRSPIQGSRHRGPKDHAAAPGSRPGRHRTSVSTYQLRSLTVSGKGVRSGPAGGRIQHPARRKTGRDWSEPNGDVPS